jgi:hypothetical protein
MRMRRIKASLSRRGAGAPWPAPSDAALDRGFEKRPAPSVVVVADRRQMCTKAPPHFVGHRAMSSVVVLGTCLQV